MFIIIKELLLCNIQVFSSVLLCHVTSHAMKRVGVSMTTVAGVMPNSTKNLSRQSGLSLTNLIMSSTGWFPSTITRKCNGVHIVSIKEKIILMVHISYYCMVQSITCAYCICSCRLVLRPSLL